jgi:hypothetical protein
MMLRLIIPVLSLLVALPLIGCRSPQPHLTVEVAPSREISLDGWENFVTPDGACKIMFPDKPQEQQYFIESPAGKLEVHSYKYTGSASYFLSYTDYPDSIDKPELSTLALDHARDGSLRQVNGRLISEANISIQGHPGRLIVVESPNGGPSGSLIRNNVYLVGRRLYSMQVAILQSGDTSVQTSHSLDSATLKFLNSFELSK